jgi:hypothetical protein
MRRVLRTSLISWTRADLLHVLLQPDFERAATIGQYWANPKARPFAELLLECEENRAERALLVRDAA